MVRGHTPDLAWRLMDAQHWASPRLARRQRVFVVADFGGQCSHEILFKPRAVQSISASGGDCWLSAACGDRGSFIEAGRRVPITRPFQCFRMRASAKERTETAFRNSFGLPTDPFPTLLAGGISPFAFWYEDDPAGGCVRFPTETECERLMGLPEGWTKYGADGEEILSSHRYRALGNATVRQLERLYPSLSGAVFHSDRGSQYTSLAFRSELSRCGMIQSLSGTGHCFDNARMESFFATLKKEKIYQIAAYKLPREQVKTIIFRYIFIYYNRVRVYTRNPLGLPPARYREWVQAQQAA